MFRFRLYFALVAMASPMALAQRVATPEWSFDLGEAVEQPAPFPNAQHAEGVLITGSSGRIHLVGPGGKVLSSMQMDLPTGAGAVPVVFQHGDESRIVAADNEGSIYCFRRDGVRMWKYVRGGKANNFRLLTVADLGGKGANEVVMTDSRGHLYAVDVNGRLRFEVTATNYRVSPAAIAEIGGSPALVFGTEDKDLYAVHADGEVIWHAQVDGRIGRALPVVASLEPEKQTVLVATAFVGSWQGLDAVDAATGKMLWRAPSLLQSYQSTAVADIDGDGAPEILYGDKSNRVFCVDANGKPRWNVHLDGRGIYFAPAIANLNGDGRATIFQVTRSEGAEGKPLYVLDSSGGIVDSWDLPGGGVSAPVLCQWQNESEVHLLVAGGSGKLIAYRLMQKPGAKILWTGLQGGPPQPLRTGTNAGEAVDISHETAMKNIVRISLGTTTIEEPSEGAALVAVRVKDPDGTIHLNLIKPEALKTVSAELLASTPGNYEVDCDWMGANDSTIQSEVSLYRAGAEFTQRETTGSGELATYVKARIAAARRLALTSGRAEDYDTANSEADYDRALMTAVEKLRPAGPIMVQVVSNPWAQHTPDTLLEEDGISNVGIQVEMLGNEYDSAAIALTNVTAQPLTLVLRSTLSTALQFRTVPTVVPDTTGKPQEDPLPLIAEGQTLHVGPAETREIWLTFHSRSLESGKHAEAIRISVLQKIAPPLEIPLNVTVSSVRLPDRFTYKHCNWLYLSSIKDPEVLDATIRDAVEHRTNVFNMPAPVVRVNCDGSIAGADSATADRLIPRLPGAFFLMDGSVEPKWPVGCSPDAATKDKGYSEALHWFGSHMRELGLSDTDYALYIHDEPGLNGEDAAFDQYVEAVKRAKAADPEIQVYTNPAGGATPEMVTRLEGLVDIWCPDLHLFRIHPAEYTAVFGRAKQFWHYEAPADQRGLDPLGFYRLKPWIAFQLGMNGGGYWVYSSKDYWIPSHDNEYGVVYPGPHGPVTTKRWEASREGSQDFELLVMLRRAARESQTPQAKAALALIDEAVEFVTRGQENASDISRHFHTYAPDFKTWMDYRARLISEAEELIH